MTLSEYRRKRNFGKTCEPEPGQLALRAGQRPIFVVQLHHASHRHYDFRLQVGQTLKSWAVPKGPSFDPTVKRLAVEVEDHPIDYAAFEGMIPDGEYGGGHVAMFDHGIWSTSGDVEAQIAKGHLQFELFGHRLKGGWHLVRGHRRARQPEWLLFKAEDAFAGKLEADDMLAGITPPPKASGSGASAKAVAANKPSARRITATKVSRKPKVDWEARAATLTGAVKKKLQSGAFAMQLAKLAARPPIGAQWLHELKWDGYRLLAVIVDGRTSLWSRNAIEWTAKLPEIVAALDQLGLRQAAFDGELIAGEGTRQDFGLLQATLSGQRQSSLHYVLFDLLHLDGVAVERAPLVQRKALLAELLRKPIAHLAFSAHIEGDGAQALELAVARTFEGIISKRADQPYHAGRSDDWRKSKRVDSDEFAVVGYTTPKGQRSGFGSLLLARPDPEFGWSYAGRVGSGFSDAVMVDIGKLIGKAGRNEASVHVGIDDPELRRAHWFAPRFVVEVFSRGRGNQGLLRQPSFKALRADKSIKDLMDSDKANVLRNRPANKKPLPPAPAASARKYSTRTAGKTSSIASGPSSEVRITHPERVVYPEDGITKQEVVDYYLAVMDYLLLEIAGRPLSIVRCPNGTADTCFFQKHRTAGLKTVDSVALKEDSGKHADYLVVNDAAAVIELVQFNALEFHPWGASAKRPDRADRIVFDLDPGPDVPWSEVKRAARQIRDLLEQLHLVAFLRTTGGKGLHLVVPLNPGCDWDLVKRFARGFADTLAQTDPDRYVAVATKSRRQGRIYIDYLRNGRGATSVASYSLRARPGAPVATPLDWDELARLKSPAAFNIRSVPRRLSRRKIDPWQHIASIKQNLSRWNA